MSFDLLWRGYEQLGGEMEEKAKSYIDLQRRSQERRGMAKLNKARCDFKLHLAKEREIIQWLTTFSANA